MHLREIGLILSLAILVSLQLQLTLGVEYSLKTDLNNSDKLTHSSQDPYDDDDEEEDVFYDVEDEISYDESAAENTCATSNKQDCTQCCDNQGFDVPFWDKTIGQCLCYVSYSEANICKDVTQSSKACLKCCEEKGYGESDFPVGEHGSQCYCSVPDKELFKSSLK